MRGRGAEFETVLGLLDGTQQCQGRVLLVEGEPGTGKSLLLARAGEEAGRRGFRVVAVSAGELSPAPSLDGLDELVSARPVLVTVDNHAFQPSHVPGLRPHPGPRVDLARIALEHARPEAAQTP